MKGKNKCKLLKEIRQKIADENDIPYVTRECSYQGDCTGTCPKCEAELRYLEQELEKRRRLGKTVAVAAVAAGLSLSLAACTPGSGSAPGVDPLPAYTLPTPTEDEAGQPLELEGRVAATEETEEPLMGKFLPAETIEGELVPDMTEEASELLGDVAYFPETPEEIPTETDDSPENLPHD